MGVGSLSLSHHAVGAHEHGPVSAQGFSVRSALEGTLSGKEIDSQHEQDEQGAQGLVQMAAMSLPPYGRL